jgi:hypothetical protein
VIARWLSFLLLLVIGPGTARGQGAAAARDAGMAVGTQYASTHVYVAPADLDGFVKSVNATFGGQASKVSVTNVLPVPSSTEFQFVWTPVGTISVRAFQTPIPFPFGLERTGYLVTEMEAAIREARAAGAEVMVEPFKDPIGRDTVIQWPGGVKMQPYWHFTAPKYPPLDTIPDNRVYVSRGAADKFVEAICDLRTARCWQMMRGRMRVRLGARGEAYRRIRISSRFGNMQVLLTDGHLPYPFGHEIAGYEVRDFGATWEKAKPAGVKILSAPYATDDERMSAIVEFPGRYVAELHSVTAR